MVAETRHRYVTVDGIEVFYRESGHRDAPTALLLHGFPSSSIQFRYLLHDLWDRWHLVAPDLPGFGFTRGTCHTFDGLAATITGFVRVLRLDVSAVYLHDYGAQVGFRLLTSKAIEPRAVIIQNSEAFRGVGWHEPMRRLEQRLRQSPEAARATLRHGLLNEAGIRREFVEDLPADCVDPAIIELGWRKINEPGIIDAMLDLHMDYGSNIERYPEVQTYLRASARPILVLWGVRDQYVSADGAHAYARDRPGVEVRLLDGGHWLLETHPTEVNAAVRTFLST